MLKDLFLALEYALSWPGEFDNHFELMEQRARRLIEASRLLKRIRTSWRDQHDPGKGQPYVFFVRDYKVHADERNGHHLLIDWCDAFFPRLFVDDLAEAELGATDWRDRSKRYPVPLGEMSEAKREYCTGCGAEAYVIGQHWQSFDSPYGDAWVLQLMRLCPQCMKVERFAAGEDNYRMTGRLKPPQK